MTVAMIAMASDPRRGSEAGVPFIVLQELLRDNRVQKIHFIAPCWGDNFAAIKVWAQESDVDNKIELHPVPFVTASERVHEAGLNYAIYWYWHIQVCWYILARRIKFDILHQINFAGFRFIGLAPLIWVPSVWGPVDALAPFPIRQAWPYLNPAGRVYYLTYNLINSIQSLCSIRFVAALRRVSLILVATKDAERRIKRRRRLPVLHVPETSSSKEMLSDGLLWTSEGKVRLLWAGLAIHRKGFPLLVEAIRLLRDEERASLQVSVFSDGPLLRSWRQLVESVGLERQFAFYGFIVRADLLKRMLQHEVLCITSFREANSTVIFEAIGSGLMPIAVGVSGYLDSIHEHFGTIVALEPSSSLASRYSTAIRQVISDRAMLRSKREKAYQHAQELASGSFRPSFVDLYEQVIVNQR
jgi:glycosyltransferase involved in cell wall biosynthesis